MYKNFLITLASLLVLSPIAMARSVSTIEKTAFLGDGYNSVSEEFADSCFEGDIRYPGNSEGRLEQTTSLRKEEMMSELNIKVGAKVSLEVISAEGASKFLASLADNELSFSTHLKNPIQGDSAALRNIRLSARGKKALSLAMQEPNPSDYFYKICGDEVVSKIDLGGKLIVSVSFNFSNRDIKTSFQSEAKVDLIDIIQADAESKIEFKKYTEDLSIKVSAIQRGGNVAQLGKIFKQATGKSKTLVSCTLKNLTPCKEAYNSVTNYVTNDQYGFVAQLKDLSYNPTQPSGAAFLKYHTVPVDQLAIPELAILNPQSIVSMQVQEARQRTLRKYIQVSKHIAKANYLLYDGISMEEEQRKKVESVLQVLENNRTMLIGVVTICRDDITKCIEAEAKAKFVNYDKSALEKKFTFFDYCKFPDVKKYSKNTVEAVIESLDIRDEEIKKDCEFIYENIVKHMTKLDLARSKQGTGGIVDLSPLTGMTSIRQIDISNNEVFSIESLASMPNLKTAILAGNRIIDISPLIELKKLEFLDISRNPDVANIQDLIEMPWLKGIWAYGSAEDMMDWLGDDLQTDNVLLTISDVCSVERSHIFKRGKITKQQYLEAQTHNLVPDYSNPEDPDNSVIHGWLMCEYGYKLLRPRKEWRQSLPEFN